MLAGEGAEFGEEGGEAAGGGVGGGVQGDVEGGLLAAGEDVGGDEGADEPDGGGDGGAGEAEPAFVERWGEGEAGGLLEAGGGQGGGVGVGGYEGEVGFEGGEKFADGAFLGGPHVLDPVVGGFGNDGDDVFDLLLETVSGAGGEFEQGAVGADGYILHRDGAEEPAGHDGVGALDPDPAGMGGGLDGEFGDEGDAAADFGEDLLVAGGVGGDGGGGGREEEFAFVRGAAGHGEVAEGGPDFVPGDLAVGGELEAGGAHGDGLDGFVAVAVGGREDGFDAELEVVVGGRGGGHGPLLYGSWR